MNLPAAENDGLEDEILDILFINDLDQLHRGDVWSRIGSSNELSMTYALFQSFLEQHRPWN